MKCLTSALEVLFAEGAPAESLFLGKEVVNALPESIVSEIASIFPELLGSKDGFVPSRLVPKGNMQKQLVACHAKNQKALLSNQTGLV